MDPNGFSKNEKPREYEVTFRVSGTIRMTIEADSVAEARTKAENMSDDEIGTDLDGADDIAIDCVRKTPTLYRVTREGKPWQVSHLKEGDVPREPDERGF